MQKAGESLRPTDTQQRRVVQISFLGRPHNTKNPKPGDPLYQKTPFRFQDGTLSEATPLFPLALGQHLQAKGRPVDCLLLIGTAESSWDVLVEALPEASQHRCVEWRGKVMQQVGANRKVVVQEYLSQIPQVFYETFPYKDIVAKVIPNATTENEQQVFMAAIMDSLNDGDDIVLDITLSLRHLPVLASFLLNALRWLKDIQVVGMYYGAFELRGGTENPPPVIDVQLAPEYAQLGAAMASYQSSGSYRALAERFSDHGERMLRVDFLENTHRLSDAQADARTLHRAFGRIAREEADPYRKAVADSLQNEWAWAENEAPQEHMLLQAACFLGHGEYLKCATVLIEALYLVAGEWYRAPEQSALRAKDAREGPEKCGPYLQCHKLLSSRMWALGIPKKRQKVLRQVYSHLNHLRNRMVHVVPEHPGKHVDNLVQRALQDRAICEQILRNGLHLGHWLIHHDQESLGKIISSKDGVGELIAEV